MSRPAAQIALAVVALVLGFLVVLQIRATGSGNDLTARSAQELTLVVANLNQRNDQLRGEIASLESELRDLESAKARGESSLGELGRDLRRLRAWAGLDPVGGGGIRITIDGPIGGEGVMELINELRNAGAEAIVVDDVRLVVGTVVAGPEDGISIEGHPLADPFVIEAIGSPETLTGSLTRAGGIVAQLGATYPEAILTVTPVERLALPATARDLGPEYGTPRL